MNLITALDINASGLTAQRQTCGNLFIGIWRIPQTTRTAEGGAYRRKDIVFQTELLRGIVSIPPWRRRNRRGSQRYPADDTRPFDRRYEPGHPDADKDGYVDYPNVNSMEEMANLIVRRPQL